MTEDYGKLSDRAAEVRVRMLQRGDQLYTSALSLAEVLVKPSAAGDEALRQRYETVISQCAVLIPFDIDAARVYARLRGSDRSIRAPDAIQLACAAHAGIDLFITNDDRLSQKNVPGIQFVTSLANASL